MEPIYLSLSPDYVSKWGVWEAVRELLQNAIDTKDYQINADRDNFKLSIVSKGGLLEKSTLLLGNSSKRNDNSTIGTYGEGFKLALLVLLREGKKVHLKNGSDIWHASFNQHPILDSKCLTINIEENVVENNDDAVIFEIEGIGASEFEDIESKVLDKNFSKNALGEYKGSYYWDKNRYENAKLYVGGLFVCDLEDGYELSYNFAPNVLHLDRDRQQVSSFDLSWEATLLISKSDNPELLAELADMGAKDVSDYVDVSSSGYSSSGVSDKIKEASSRQFIKTHGDKAYPINSSWEEKQKRIQSVKAIDAGLIPVTISNGYYKMIDKSITEKDISSYSEFNLSSAIRDFYAENKNQLRGKPRKRLEEILEILDLYEGNRALPEEKARLIVKDNDVIDNDIPF